MWRVLWTSLRFFPHPDFSTGDTQHLPTLLSFYTNWAPGLFPFKSACLWNLHSAANPLGKRKLMLYSKWQHSASALPSPTLLQSFKAQLCSSAVSFDWDVEGIRCCENTASASTRCCFGHILQSCFLFFSYKEGIFPRCRKASRLRSILYKSNNNQTSCNSEYLQTRSVKPI